MSKMKVAVAQINYKPAMIMKGRNLLIEPFGSTDTSISSLAFQGDSKLQRESREAYLAWIKQKIVSILRVAVSHNVRIIVFPEYSIPVEIISDISAVLLGSETLVVAGTHMVTNDKINRPSNYPPTKQFVRCAMCPIVSSNGIEHFVIKTHRAASEVGNIDLPKNYIPTPLDIDNISLYVKICIDAITLEDHCFPNNSNCIVAIPSWSYSVAPFSALATISKYNERPILYANCADVGGSTISAPYLKSDAHWYLNAPFNNSMPQNTEGLVIVNIDTEHTAHSVGTVRISPSASIEAVYNIFYQNDEKHKRVMEEIDSYLSLFEEEPNPEKLQTFSDLIYSDKLRFLRQQYNNGVLTAELANECLHYVKVNAPNFKQLQIEQSRNALKKIGSAFAQSPTDNDLLIAISSLSTMLQSLNDQNEDGEKFINDDKLFYGRDDEVIKLCKFINSGDQLLLLRGIRGIGKSKLLKKIESKVLPDTSPWIIKYIEFRQGIGYELLLDTIEYNLGLSYIERNNASPAQLAKRYMSQIAYKQPTIIQFDDIQYLTEVNGKFSDTNVEEFIIGLLKETKNSQNVKIIMATNRQIPRINTLVMQTMEVSRLSDDEIQTIIEYCYRKKSPSIRPLEISDQTIGFIYGNPLTAILVAQLVQAEKLSEFETKGELFKRFQEQQIKNLLDEIDLTQEEELIISIISVGKGTLSIDFFRKYLPYLLSSLNQLITRLMIENNEGDLGIHPIFKDYYYNKLKPREREQLHLKISKYYEGLCKNTGKERINPIVLSSLIYHLAGSMQTDKLKKYKLKYIDELLPIADNLFHEQSYAEALNYYELIHNQISQRKDILIKMAQCSVYCINMSKADEYFNLAIEANPRGAYLYAKYSIALSSQKTSQKRAIEIANQAEVIYRQYGKTIAWELAEVKYAQAKSLRYSNPQKAQELFEAVCELEKTNSYYLCMYAKFLYENDQPEKGEHFLEKVRLINSKYHLYISLFEKYIKNHATPKSESEDEDIDGELNEESLGNYESV